MFWKDRFLWPQLSHVTTSLQIIYVFCAFTSLCVPTPTLKHEERCRSLRVKEHVLYYNCHIFSFVLNSYRGDHLYVTNSPDWIYSNLRFYQYIRLKMTMNSQRWEGVYYFSIIQYLGYTISITLLNFISIMVPF